MPSLSPEQSTPPPTRLKLVIRGAVQGVGFRPFIFRLATELGLKGWVNNSAQGVFLEVEGGQPALQDFLLRVEAEKPPRSFIQSLEALWLDSAGYRDFAIRQSEDGGAKTALVLPDIATCPDCLCEIFDPHNRRYFYPFTNCTNCGPRFSIIEALPYDRAHTSMRRFQMCPQCQAEYDDPRNRRFHAQPNACPVCGPRVELWDRSGGHLAADPRAALAATADAIHAGKIVAVKGLGGFHLMVAAQNEQAVRRLRELKHREEKPFALMFPGLEAVKAVCALSPLEERLLRSPEAPIVLLRRLAHPKSAAQTHPLAPSLAPTNPNLGVLLPYTPLHHLLLSLLRMPVVATSANLSDEPICTDEHEALERLGGIADLFLVHNRPIVRHVDDSVARVMAGREIVLRRARGYAPLPVPVFGASEASGESGGSVRSGGSERTANKTRSVLAVGPHLKNTVALAVGAQAFISQHIGDLETSQALEAFQRVISDLEQLYESRPELVVADAHPDYLATKFARELAARTEGLRYTSVQHHLAHVLSCMAENELTPPVLGVAWDGTGYGLDGTIWGGEFFLITAEGWQRVAHLRRFRLPGGEKAIQEPRRTALGLLYEAYGGAAFERTELTPLQTFSPRELASLKTMLARQLNSPVTSSAGRLFDAVASLSGLRQQVRFEGQAAMELEFCLKESIVNGAYPLTLVAGVPGSSGSRPPDMLDWSPLLEALLADLQNQAPVSEIAAKFHNGLVEGILAVCRQVGQARVVLSGGCFQNRYLTEQAVRRLQQAGFRPYWHQRVPPNDGGISLGQIVAVPRYTV